jgi:hypothetical protein
LFAFIAAAKEQHAGPAQHRVVHPISRPPVDPKFGYSLAKRLAIAEVPKRKPVNPHSNSRSQMGVKTCQPVADQIFSCSGDIPTNLDHACNVSYKLQSRKPESKNSARFLLFSQKEFKALEKYPKDYGIVSSLVQIQLELAMWRRIGIGIVVSFIALTLTLLGLHNNLLRETISNGKDVVQIKDQLSAAGISKQTEKIQKDLDQIKDRIDNEERERLKLEQKISPKP